MNRPIPLLVLLFLLHAAAPAAAKDGDSGGGSNSGSGSSNSGSDHDDDRDDDRDDDDDDRDDDDDDRDDDSHRARDGVSSGSILPLATILRRLDSGFAGRLIDADLKRRGGRVIYELQIVTPAGRVLEVDVDAATARVVKYEVE
jgi:uncharacterized membrane protein YkoI